MKKKNQDKFVSIDKFKIGNKKITFGIFTLKSLDMILNQWFKNIYDKIYTIGFHSGFYSSLNAKIWVKDNYSRWSCNGPEFSGI